MTPVDSWSLIVLIILIVIIVIVLIIYWVWGRQQIISDQTGDSSFRPTRSSSLLIPLNILIDPFWQGKTVYLSEKKRNFALWIKIDENKYYLTPDPDTGILYLQKDLTNPTLFSWILQNQPNRTWYGQLQSGDQLVFNDNGSIRLSDNPDRNKSLDNQIWLIEAISSQIGPINSTQSTYYLVNSFFQPISLLTYPFLDRKLTLPNAKNLLPAVNPGVWEVRCWNQRSYPTNQKNLLSWSLELFPQDGSDNSNKSEEILSGFFGEIAQSDFIKFSTMTIQPAWYYQIDPWGLSKRISNPDDIDDLSSRVYHVNYLKNKPFFLMNQEHILVPTLRKSSQNQVIYSLQLYPVGLILGDQTFLNYFLESAAFYQNEESLILSLGSYFNDRLVTRLQLGANLDGLPHLESKGDGKMVQNPLFLFAHKQIFQGFYLVDLNNNPLINPRRLNKYDPLAENLQPTMELGWIDPLNYQIPEPILFQAYVIRSGLNNSTEIYQTDPSSVFELVEIP